MNWPGCRRWICWYSRIDIDALTPLIRQIGNAKQLKRFDKNLAKTRSKDSMRAFGKLTEMVDGEPESSATRR